MRSTQRTGPDTRISWYLLPMGPLRGMVLACLVATTSGAAAQTSDSDGAQLFVARRAVLEGNFELALGTYLQLARRSDDPVVQLELAEVPGGRGPGPQVEAEQDAPPVLAVVRGGEEPPELFGAQ